ncbi:MAG: AAA family ATPase, partial [Clostridia bacterium]
MKILRIEVYNFGKLKNFCLDFNNAITVISEYNGYGKTTIAEFIRAMFYGIERSRLAKIEDNIYKRVRPWNCDGKFGGSLTYENLGKAYKVTRMFGATASADESTLIEVATGVSLSCDNLGERLFNLDESAFIRCFYIPQEAIVVQNNDSFKASLCSVLSSESSQQYTNALEKLRSARRLLKKEKGEGGAIFDATERKKQLVSARDKATSIYAQMDSNDIKIIEIKQQLLEIDKRQKIVSGNIDSLQQNRPTDNLIKQKQSFEERISEINASLYALPTFTDVDRALPVCLDSLCSERRALLEKQKLSLSAPRPLSRISIIMFIISAALAIGGVITAVLNLIAVAITLFILGVLSLFVAIFARRQNGKSENKELDNLIFNNSSNFQQIFDKFGLSYGDDFFDMSAQLKGYYNQYVTLRARLCDSEKYLQDISTSTFDSNAYNA